MIVDFGLDVKGLIPPHHLFDQVVASSSLSTCSHYCSLLLKVKYVLNAKVNAHVWMIHVMNWICTVDFGLGVKGLIPLIACLIKWWHDHH